VIKTAKKTSEEVVSALEGCGRVFLLGCGGCPVGAETGTEADLAAWTGALKDAGKEVTGAVTVDFLCNKILLGTRLQRNADMLRGVDAVCVSSCGVGVQAAAKIVDCRTVPLLNTVSMGGLQGLYPASERCGECGDCVLHLTAGICPITGCAKQLLNGPCGGSRDGMCEVDPENRECAWDKIVNRLTELDGLALLEKPVEPKAWKLPELDTRRY